MRLHVSSPLLLTACTPPYPDFWRIDASHGCPCIHLPCPCFEPPQWDGLVAGYQARSKAAGGDDMVGSLTREDLLFLHSNGEPGAAGKQGHTATGTKRTLTTIAAGGGLYLTPLQAAPPVDGCLPALLCRLAFVRTFACTLLRRAEEAALLVRPLFPLNRSAGRPHLDCCASTTACGSRWEPVPVNRLPVRLQWVLKQARLHSCPVHRYPAATRTWALCLGSSR